MKIGLLKSKIEEHLTSAYQKGTLKTEIKNFKSLVLEDKKLSKIFYLYDQLSENKGYTNEFAAEFILESSLAFKDLYTSLDNNKLTLIENWVGKVKSDNKYSDIDNVFNSRILSLEEKIKSKKTLTESLQKKPSSKSEVINLPISTMVKMANKKILEHIETLSENDKKELFQFIGQDKTEAEKQFIELKKNVISKLNTLQENSEVEVKSKIQETLQKINENNFSLENYFKLKSLNEGL